jgi:hypothetical protein
VFLVLVFALRPQRIKGGWSQYTRTDTNEPVVDNGANNTVTDQSDI